MTLDEYKEEYYSKWQLRITRYCWIITAIHFFATTFLNVGLFFTEVFTLSAFISHTFFRSVLPMLIQISILIPSIFLVFKTDISTKNKCRIVVFDFFWIMTVMAFFQSKYSLFLLFPAIPMFLAAILTERKMLNLIFISSLLLLPLTIATWGHFFSDGFTSHHVVATVSLVATTVLIYFISLEILKAQVSLISYMHQTYEKQEELSEAIQIEPLTKLYNRKALSSTLHKLIDNFNQPNFDIEKNQAAIVFIDLDNFKKINDNYGHGAGDSVLIALAEAFQTVLKTKRNSFRYGGDEFVVILKNKSRDEVAEIISSIMKEFQRLSAEKLSDNSFCTMSIGISFYKKGMSHKEWLREADDATYKAKLNGKNQFCIIE